MFLGFSEDSVPNPKVEKPNQKGPVHCPWDATACRHPVDAFHYISRGDLCETQELLKKMFCELSKMVTFCPFRHAQHPHIIAP